jgi:hypothetical protein
MIIAILPGFATAQVVSGSVNTPSGYSIDSTTGNLIPYDSSLKTNNGWTSTTGAAGNWTPYGSPQGSFNATDGYTFSYVGEELGIAGVNLGNFAHGYQNTNAVFVTGFMYGLKYRFPCANQIGGSCTDTSGPQDTLRVEVGYYPSSGAATFYLHQLGLKNITDGNSAYNPAWQQLAETVTFAGAKTLAQAGTVNMGIYGQDAGYWACLMPDCYGPQVKDAYIRANYSVDPCILNPAYSPSCPGFQNVLQGSKSPAFYYSYNIAQSLPHIGGGVVLHGYDYGFNWYNYGACYNTFLFWCTDWRTDGGGNINFRISDKNNTTMFQQQWYVSGNNSGGSYSNRYLFTESQNSLNMGSIQWWTDSVWNHFGWSGWTKPIWTPDPCYEQPLYSPNCSNFDAEIKRLAAEQKALQDAQLTTMVASISTTPTSTVTTTIQDATTTNPTVIVTTQEIESVKPSLAQSTIKPVETVDSAATQSSKPVGVRVEQADNTNFALNLVRQNQQRENAIAQQASQGAIQTANVAATASIRQAESLALESAKTSQTSDKQEQQTIGDLSVTIVKQDQLLTLGSQPSSIVNIGQQSRQQTVAETTTQQTSTSTSALVVFNAMQAGAINPVQEIVLVQPPLAFQPQQTQQSTYQPPQQVITETKPQTTFQQDNLIGNNQIITLQLPQQTTEVVQSQLQATNIAPVSSIELPSTNLQLLQQLPVISADIPQTQQTFTTDRTSPLNTLLETKPNLQLEEDTKEIKTASVNTKSEDNTIAGGVSISAISVVPVGFSAYTIALADASFYQPKEIYRNQRTIDNRRALQNLRSDQLHEQMINQQWR